MKLQNREWKMHQRLQRHEENQPNPWHCQKTTSHPWENEANNQKMCNENTHRKFWMPERAWREGKMGEENMPTWKHSRMAYVFGFFLAQGVKMCFPKTNGFSNSNLGCHTLHIPWNNQLNQFLAVINDCVNKTRKVVDSFDGFPLWHLDFPHWPQR